MQRDKMIDLSYLADKWPSGIVARTKVGEFSGGILNPRTLANLDSQGLGPKKRIQIGNKIAYPVDSLIEWLQGRAVLISSNK